MRHTLRLPAFVLTLALCASGVFGCLAHFANAQESNSPPSGFTALFNGRDFKDWTGGTTRDPREIAALDEAKRGEWDAKMQDGINTHWRVEDGALVSDGKEPYLATKAEYRDFELWVDWLIGAKGDSGIYLRGAPQVQIWDPTNPAAFKHGNEKGSGALWNNKTNERFPMELADRPIGEWNRMYIRMVGPYVSVTLNGKPVVKNVVMENYYDRSIPIFARGPIYLQTHGAETRFRNVFLREIPPAEADREMAEIGGADGFQSVFNGKDLSGFTGALDSYEVVDGALQCKAGQHGNLLTKDTYDNFVARLEFKLPPGGNNGLALRAESPEGELAYDAIEVQVLDDTSERYKDIKPYQINGSLYGLVAAPRGYLRPVGEWNYEEVTVDGDHVTIRLNGFEIVNADLAKLREKPIDGKPHPGAARSSGHFGFCGHNEPVAFRKIRIKRLSSN